jgi:hypothetical protein
VALPDPANYFFSLHKRFAAATCVMSFAIHDVGFEQLLKVTVQWIRPALCTHLLEQLPETLNPFAVELEFDA